LSAARDTHGAVLDFSLLRAYIDRGVLLVANLALRLLSNRMHGFW